MRPFARWIVVVVGMAGVLAGSRLAGAAAVPRPVANALPSEAVIRRLMAERVDAAGEGVGIVVGVVGQRGRRILSYGRLQGGSGRLDGDTGFEIGSVTKVFTALLLAEMVRRGEVALADPVAKDLPAGVRIPDRNGRAITLVDLATHTSGLPFMPDAATGTDEATAAKLYQFLARCELQSDASVRWDYSNLGYWLLGEALAHRAGMSFESLLRTRVLLPLGMRSTAVTITPALRAKLAAGHDASLQPAPAFSQLPLYRLMPAAGGLVSTANDLATFLAVALGDRRSPLAPAMADLLRTRRPGSRPGVEQALGWVVEGDDPLVFHDGGTFGYASALAWDPKRRVGVIVLMNQVGDVGDLARHLLRPDLPLAKPAAVRKAEIPLEAAVLDAYAGRYEAPGEGVFVIAREGAFLTFAAPADWGLPKLRLRPESRRDFFASELPLRVTFQTDDQGRAKGLLIYPPRGQKAVPASRIAPD
jgi:D-alanyl-D-alanine-carboxypeptidase/D-alanyl-D-alanine-endopeptidase